MSIPITMRIQLLIIVALSLVGIYQYLTRHKGNQNQNIVLEYAVSESMREQEQLEKARQMAMEEEQAMQKRSFSLDVLVRHGSAFGGFSAFLSDGRRRKGAVSLDQIMMYGRHPSGNDFTYYIEEEGLEICPASSPDDLIVRSKMGPFEIRDAGVGRDQGVSTTCATIHKNIVYYIVLESKHEISMKATKCC